jgi:hypothetical protein
MTQLFIAVLQKEALQPESGAFGKAIGEGFVSRCFSCVHKMWHNVLEVNDTLLVVERTKA